LQKRQFWDKCLTYTPDELQQPWLEFKALRRGATKPEYPVPEWVIKSDYAAFNWKIPFSIPTKRVNLDTRLQIHLAAVLRYHFPKLSLRTVARLVMLLYVCGGLVRETENRLVLVHSDKPTAKAEPPTKLNEGLTVAKVE